MNALLFKSGDTVIIYICEVQNRPISSNLHKWPTFTGRSDDMGKLKLSSFRS